MKTYVKFSDLPYPDRYELYDALRSSDIISFVEFDNTTIEQYEDNLSLIVVNNGSGEILDDDSNHLNCNYILTTKNCIFLAKERYQEILPTVEVYDTRSYYESQYVKIPKLEYDRLLEIERFYNLLNNDN